MSHVEDESLSPAHEMEMKIDHIGIAVQNLDRALDLYSGLLGFDIKGIHPMDDEGMRIAVIASGGTVLELIEPLDSDSPVGRFLASRGGGLHHLCLSVSDFDGTLTRLQSNGLRLAGTIRTGVKGSRIAFFHPKDTLGVLIEISEGKE